MTQSGEAAENAEEARDRPLEEAQKTYHTILEQQIEQAGEELKRPAVALLLSGFTAGLDVGFGPLAMAVVLTLTRGVLAHPFQQLLTSNLYSIGFIFVVIGRSALFTEHTTSAVLPVLDGRAPISALLRLWGLVIVSNVIGAAIFAWFATRMGPALGIADTAAFGEIATRLTSKSSVVIFCSAIGAGWVMGLLSWLAVAGRDTTSQIIIVWLCTFVIGLAGLHHSVAGTSEVLSGFLAGADVTLADFGRFLVLAVLGNAVGGTVFVASLKYSHVKAT